MTIGVPELKSKPLSRVEGRFIAVAVCALFFCFELAIGASYAFAGLMALFLALAFATIQSLGGIASFLGLSMTFLVCQHVLISQFFKAYMGQAPESRLDAPIATMAAYCTAMAGYLVGSQLSKLVKLRGGRPLYSPVIDTKLLARMAVVAAIIGLLRQFIVMGSSGTDEGPTTGGVFGIIRNLDMLDTLAVACATAYVVKSTDRRQLVGPLTFFAAIGPALFGIIGGHRANFLYPVATILLAGWAFGFRYRAKHAAFMAFGLWFFVFVFSPFAVAIRSAGRSGNFSRDLSLSINALFEHTINQTTGDEKPVRQIKTSPEIMATRYYGINDYATSTLYERFAIMKATDAIVNVTRNEGTTEMATITPGFLMAVPSLILPEKPVLGVSNMIAHRVPGWVGENDYHTQITFGLPAESFSAFGWLGAFCIPAFVTFLIAVAYRWVIRLEMTENVYAIALAPRFAVYFAVATFQSSFISATQNALVVVVTLYIVHQLAKLADFKYLHPRRRQATVEKLSGPA